MAVKTTGAEWKRFYNDKTVWPDGAWHDDEELTIDGRPMAEDDNLDAVPPDAQMTIAGGVVFMKAGDDYGPSLESHFKRWRKAQSTVFLSVECPRELVDAVLAGVLSAGGKARAL